MTSRKIAVLTTSRADYGLLKFIASEIDRADDMELQLIVSGSHYSEGQGFSYEEILNDGFEIEAEIVPPEFDDSREGMSQLNGFLAEKVPMVYQLLEPDLLIVLGDRFELMPFCTAAVLQNIPIAHFSGGDITEGVIDDVIRYSVSRMASLHFPGTEDSAQRLRKSGEQQNRIYVVGEPGLEAIKKLKLFTKEELAEILDLDKEKKWINISYHPESWMTKDEVVNTGNNILNALSVLRDIEIIITASNHDFHGKALNDLWEIRASESSDIHYIPHLGQLKFLSMLKHADLMLGNSSSAIVEAPSFDLPVVNIGNRQKGRLMADNIVESGNSQEEITNAIFSQISIDRDDLNVYNPYGDGNTSALVIEILKQTDFSELLPKKFLL